MGDGRHLASLGASGLCRFRDATHARSKTMTGADKVVCQAAALLLLFTLTTVPAKAQFAGFGGGDGGGGGGDMMTQMAPMLEMMKAKMGKRRFAMLMQTMGPMMSQMMEGGSSGGFGGGGIPGGFGGGGDVMGMLGGDGGGQLMSMIPQLTQMANFGGGHRRHRRR
jgi:uncharacterized membrane protein YgcG